MVSLVDLGAFNNFYYNTQLIKLNKSTGKINAHENFHQLLSAMDLTYNPKHGVYPF